MRSSTAGRRRKNLRSFSRIRDFSLTKGRTPLAAWGESGEVSWRGSLFSSSLEVRSFSFRDLVRPT
jgi:hypothetical protein